jgi:NADPH2:quinone reductase
MKAAVLSDERSLDVHDRDRPQPPDDHVLVAVEACGVCTTDYHMYEGGLSVDLPMIPGHESAGEVVEVGDDVSRVDVGDRVAINPSVPCNACRQCKAGNENRCVELTSIGGAAEHVVDGSFAEYVAVPAGNVELIGDLSYRDAAFAEPLGCCVHGVDRLDVTSGESAAVVGAGPIGLLLVQALRLEGASPIIVSEPEDARRAVALDVGADYAVDPIEEDAAEVVDDIVGGVDVAIEAVGNPATIQQAQSLTVPGGRTLVFGVPPEDATMEVSPFDIFYDELELLGTYSLTPDSFARAVRFLQTGRVDVDSLVTHECGLYGITDAFDRMGESEGLKQMVYPQASDADM